MVKVVGCHLESSPMGVHEGMCCNLKSSHGRYRNVLMSQST